MPAAARRPAGASTPRRHATATAGESDELSATAVAALDPEPEPEILAEAPAVAPAGGRSNWQLLLDEIDRLLRDPTLTRALAASVRRVRHVTRALAAATLDSARRVSGAVARLLRRLPRRLLLALLALMLPLVLLALLSSSDDQRATRGAGAQPAGATAAGPSPSGIPMPDLLPAAEKPRQVRVALVVDRSYAPAALRRELRALGAWLADNHAAGTRLSVIDGSSARASRPLRAADLAGARLERPRASTPAAIRSAFGRQKRGRLLVTLGSAAPPSSSARTVRIAAQSGAGAASSTQPGQSGPSSMTIDDRRPNALAASIARAIMAISGQSERG